MVKQNKQLPDYIFESSWEVCNKVGGIYTVLSTKAKTLQKVFKDKIIFIGPDFREDTDFIEDKNLFNTWKEHLFQTLHLNVRIGNWNVPGKPIVILIDFRSYFLLKDKNSIYYHMWDKFQVDSLHAYGDYDEACLFAYSTGLIIENFYNFNQLQDQKVIAHFNEWMLGMGALYLQDKIPAIATIFTTHATSIGRSIAGNGKPLYAYFNSYNGDRMAKELHMESKHSIEKQTAKYVDCFTTVSNITAKECKQLLEKEPDIVTPNGFENNFVPSKSSFPKKRREARKILLDVSEQLTGEKIADDALIVITSGRYEYKNKGIDVFVEALNQVRTSEHDKSILAFIMVPAWRKGPRIDLQHRLKTPVKNAGPLPDPFITHDLYEPQNDRVCNQLNYLDFINHSGNNVKLFFVPSYVNENDGIFNLSYYDILIGADLTVFPSYYEPWGYTPLESIAFGIPTITTDLAGFGCWAKDEEGVNNIFQGVEVLHRNDENYFDIAEKIKNSILSYSQKSKDEILSARQSARNLSERADWSCFIDHYYNAYDIALKNAAVRSKN